MEISLTKRNEFKFKLNIEGAKELPEARMVLKFPNFSVMVNGTVSNNVAKIQLPDLSHLKSEGFESADVLLEVVVNGQYRIPWKATCSIEKEITAEATMITSEVKQEDEDISVEAVIEEVTIPKKPRNVVFPK